MSMQNLRKTIEQIVDVLALRLNTYELAIYLYLFRHTRLKGQKQIFISVRKMRMTTALGQGRRGTLMSDTTCRATLRRLAEKGCIRVEEATRLGCTMRVYLPHELKRLPSGAPGIPREDGDYFHEPSNRLLIFMRDGYQCFYCRRVVEGNSIVLDHVVSRPRGDDSYRNVVAACSRCNARKRGTRAEDFLRELYREGVLTAREFGWRQHALRRLKKGLLKPAA
jgi:hypothetical protein